MSGMMDCDEDMQMEADGHSHEHHHGVAPAGFEVVDDASAQKRIPVTILSGFLGSGKTTLLNHILEDPNHGLRFAIIENELGAVGVDQKILSEKADEEILEVMNGCICCTVRGDLIKALTNLYSKISQFDAVIIECTGMADPSPVAQTFFSETAVETMYELDGIITVVDAKYVKTWRERCCCCRCRCCCS